MEFNAKVLCEKGNDIIMNIMKKIPGFREVYAIKDLLLHKLDSIEQNKSSINRQLIDINQQLNISTLCNYGYCPICEEQVQFVIKGGWLRDQYFCCKCGSIPRNRAILVALNTFAPDWRNSLIHESSPGGVSLDKIKNSASGYSCSQYFPGIKSGDNHNGTMCQDLGKMSFPDNKFDIFITQDVLEHLMHPDKALSEISRVLKPGGMHIFTMPWYPELKTTRCRAKEQNGKIHYLEEQIYHGNPVDASGSLVTFDWGLDFTDFVWKNSGMTTTIYLHKDRNLGLDAEFLHVFISRKI